MSKTFCSYPWRHLYVHTTGHQKICCMSEDNITKQDGYHQFNMKQDQILDSWNSEYMKQIRLKMIAGEDIINCKKCVTAEFQGLQSMRTVDNKEKWISSTNQDGSVNHLPTDLELHFGNTCNLHCKMCSQQFSHMIGKELLRMGEADPEFLQWVKKESGVLNNWTGELDIEYDWYKNEKVKKSIFEHVSKNVERLVVIGGEPTIIKEFYELLDYCNTNGTLQNKSLCITTNMTNTNKNLSTWLGSVKQFMIHASIDGLAERNTYIRYPCNWNSVLNSLEFYKNTIKSYNNGNLSFAPAIQLLNIDQLPELCNFFIENFISKNCSIAWISQVRYPIVCDYAILPTDYKLKIADKIEQETKNINHKFTVKNLLGHANDLRTESFTEEQKKNYQKMFIQYNDTQDKFRKSTTWRQLIPNLETALTKSIS
jgi:MoaA/NifB/PqqE/SkfB family radical SAM enzyme